MKRPSCYDQHRPPEMCCGDLGGWQTKQVDSSPQPEIYSAPGGECCWSLPNPGFSQLLGMTTGPLDRELSWTTG